jgi:hypothetical protein
MNGTERVQPSSWYYLLAVAIFVGGLGLMLLLLGTGMHRVKDSMVRGEIPGQMDLDLKRLQPYTIFVEEATGTKGGAFSLGSSMRDVNCEVHAEPSEENIPTKWNVLSSSYTYGLRSGVSMMEFEVPRDGTYRIDCRDNRKAQEPKLEIAVGGNATKAISAVYERFFGGGGRICCWVARFCARGDVAVGITKRDSRAVDEAGLKGLQNGGGIGRWRIIALPG